MPSNRRRFIQSGMALTAAAVTSNLVLADKGSRADLLIDGLGFPGSMTTEPEMDLNQDEVAAIAQSRLSATHLTVGAVGSMAPLAAFEKIVRDLGRWERQVDRHPAVLSRVRKAADIEVANKAGTTGLIYGLQDGVAIENDLQRLEALQQLGIRIIQPTYNRRNLLGDGCMEPANAGLSRKGVEAIARMNELGILVDLSHCGARTAADAIATSSRSVAFTHTGCDALVSHPRHRSDKEIRAVAEGGGVTGIYIMPYLAKGRQPTAADVIAHLEHALTIAGEDHVAVGTDGQISPAVLTDEYKQAFAADTRKRAETGIAAPYETETGYLFANDLNTPDRFVTLAQQLGDRGLPGRVVDKIMGGNLLRLFTDSWTSG